MKLVVMGVSGCGKTTLGKALADRLGASFVDADDLHPPENVEKMRQGQPLTDADRAPWLDLVANTLRTNAPVVVACSALKRAYRARLRQAGEVRFLHPAAPFDVIAARMAARQGHYMPPALLASQFSTLEPPGPDEAVTLDASLTPDAILKQALACLS